MSPAERRAGRPPGHPPGTFRIDREGAWHHEGQEITHPGVLENLYANLRADADGHYLQVGPARLPVEVEDAPFVVTRVETSPLDATRRDTLRLHLSDGTHEDLTPHSGSVWLGANDAPYCRVKGDVFTARFSVAAWLQLARFVEEETGSGRPVLVLGGRRTLLERRG